MSPTQSSPAAASPTTRAEPAGTVLITGATSGLGLPTAVELHQRGWTVLAHGRSEAKLADLNAATSGGVIALLADLSSLAEVRSLAGKVLDRVDRLDVLVNNAAVGFGRPNVSREVSTDGHELRMAVNCVHPAALMDTAMVRESGYTPMSTVDEGLAAVLAQVTDPEVGRVTGQFYSGTHRATALALAYDPRFRRDLREVTERMLAIRAGREAG